jgi:hypothetical protein
MDHGLCYQFKQFNQFLIQIWQQIHGCTPEPPKKQHKKQFNQVAFSKAWSEAIPSSGACCFKEEVKNVS